MLKTGDNICVECQDIAMDEEGKCKGTLYSDYLRKLSCEITARKDKSALLAINIQVFNHESPI